MPALALETWTRPDPAEATGRWQTWRPTQTITVTQELWRLVIVPGDQPTYKLFHLPSDPEQQHDLAANLDQILLRLRGVAERQERSPQE